MILFLIDILNSLYISICLTLDLKSNASSSPQVSEFRWPCCCHWSPALTHCHNLCSSVVFHIFLKGSGHLFPFHHLCRGGKFPKKLRKSITGEKRNMLFTYFTHTQDPSQQRSSQKKQRGPKMCAVSLMWAVNYLVCPDKGLRRRQPASGSFNNSWNTDFSWPQLPHCYQGI